MYGRHQYYHQGYEGSMAHQAAIRAVAAQDRLACHALAAGHVRWHIRLVARLHALRLRSWTGRVLQRQSRPCPPTAQELP